MYRLTDGSYCHVSTTVMKLYTALILADQSFGHISTCIFSLDICLYCGPLNHKASQAWLTSLMLAVIFHVLLHMFLGTSGDEPP